MSKRYISIEGLMSEVYEATEDGAKLDYQDFEALIDHMPKSDWVELDTPGDTPRIRTALDKVVSERRHQIEKWGANAENHPFEWMSILGEEFGELCQAVNETCFRNGTHPERGGVDKVIHEAVQVAAVAVALVEQCLKMTV